MGPGQQCEHAWPISKDNTRETLRGRDLTLRLTHTCKHTERREERMRAHAHALRYAKRAPQQEHRETTLNRGNTDTQRDAHTPPHTNGRMREYTQASFIFVGCKES